MMKMQLVAVVALSLSSAYAHAHGSCKDDISKHCADVKPGDGRLAACLKAHETELSATCKAQEAEHKAKMEEWSEACKADRDTLCKDVQTGNGRVASCMHDNEAKLSAPCKAKFAHMKKRVAELHKDCAADLKANCKAVKGGSGAKIQCLNEHIETLTPACKEHIDDMQ